MTFPEEYGAKELAGKAATFDITAKKLQAGDGAGDRRRAGRRSWASRALDEVRELITGADPARIRPAVAPAPEARAARRAGRAAPTSRCREGMVEAEFDQIWQRSRPTARPAQDDEDDKGKDDDTLKAEYRAIAERRVRLGLLLAEIGRANAITVSQRGDDAGDARRGGALSGPGAAGDGVLPQEPAGGRTACAARSSRRRWSISCWNWPRSTEQAVTPGGTAREPEPPRRGRGCRRRPEADPTARPADRRATLECPAGANLCVRQARRLHACGRHGDIGDRA